MKPRYHLIQKIIILLIGLLIPFFCFSYYSLYQANQDLEQQILQSIHTENTFYINTLDETLQQIYHMDYHLLDNNNWVHFSERIADMSIYTKGQYINNMIEQLTLIKNLTPYLESVHIYFPDMDVIYHSSPYEYGSFTTLESEQTETWNQLFQNSLYLQYYTDPISNKKTLSLLMPPQSQAIDYRIIFTLSIPELRQSLQGNISYADDHYIFSTEGGYVLSDFDASLHNEVQELSTSIENKTFEPYYFSTKLNNQPYYVFCYRLTYSDILYMRLISASSILSIVPSSYILFGAFCILLVFVCILFFIGIYNMVHRPLTELSNGFTQIEKGNFNVHVVSEKESDFSYLFNEFNHMVSKLNTLIEENYTQTVLLQKAELRQLQAQINPHFLYNSFFMLQRMIRLDSEQAWEIANALGQYFHYITRNSEELVPVSNEYEHAKNYAYIQQLRFAGRITIEFGNLPEEYASITVPKLILQPLMENSFKYGLAHKIQDGLLRVSFVSSENELKILVEDNGEFMADTVFISLSKNLEDSIASGYNGEMTGILNIQKRLIIFSHYPKSLRIFRSSIGGLGVEICLKKTRSIAEQ